MRSRRGRMISRAISSGWRTYKSRQESVFILMQCITMTNSVRRSRRRSAGSFRSGTSWEPVLNRQVCPYPFNGHKVHINRRAQSHELASFNCFKHDASAVLIQDGRIVAAAEEERFNGQKH